MPHGQPSRARGSLRGEIDPVINQTGGQFVRAGRETVNSKTGDGARLARVLLPPHTRGDRRGLLGPGLPMSGDGQPEPHLTSGMGGCRASAQGGLFWGLARSGAGAGAGIQCLHIEKPAQPKGTFLGGIPAWPMGARRWFSRRRGPVFAGPAVYPHLAPNAPSAPEGISGAAAAAVRGGLRGAGGYFCRRLGGGA